MFELIARWTHRPAEFGQSRTARALWRRGYRDGERRPTVPHHWANR